jgi:protein-S-isoprenylcysteine O-methyltransferase Ste14
MSRAEERDLVIRYGDAYRTYLQRTGMYLPKRRRTHASANDAES